MRKIIVFLVTTTLLCTAVSCESLKQVRAKREIRKKQVEDSLAATEVELRLNDSESIPFQDALPPYRPVRTMTNDILHTKLALRFDWEKRHVMGKAWLTVKPYFYPVSMLELDAQTFDFHKVALVKADGSITDLKYTYNGNIIKISLDKTYQGQESYQVLIDYTAKPYEKPEGGGLAVTSDRGLFFVNHDGKEKDVPRQIWTQGETSWNSCWFPTFDHPSEKTTQEMEITVENRYITVSNGAKIKSEIHPDGTRTDYWKMEKPHSPYLFALAIGEFGEFKDSWRGKEVNYYLEPKYAPFAKDIFGNTPEMMEFFSNLLGVEYPWEKYAQVVVREFVSGAMENTTCSIFFDAMNMDDRELLDEDHEDIIAHELFHHWFGDYVTCESYANLALNESFASYSEYLWIEHKYGKDQADAHLQEDLSSYLMEANWKKVPIIRYNYNNEDDMFDAHSYQKGACVLHALRAYVGDSAFFVTLNRYLKQYALKNTEIHQLRIAFEETTGQDLNWFFNQWFLSPGHPEIEFDYEKTNAGLRINVKQLQDTNPFRLLFRIQVTSSEGKNSFYPVEIQTRDTLFNLAFQGKVENVILDSDGTLLGEVKRGSLDLTTKQMVSQYRNALNVRNKIEAIDYLSANYSYEGEQALLEATKDPFYLVRMNALGTLDFGKSKQKEVLLQRSFELTTDKKSLVRAMATAIFGKRAVYNLLKTQPLWKTKIDSLIHYSLKDRSYSVINAGLSVAESWERTKAEAFIHELNPEKDHPSFLYNGIGILMENPNDKNIRKTMEIIEKVPGTNERYYTLNSFLRLKIEDMATDIQGLTTLSEGLINIAENDMEADIRSIALALLLEDNLFKIPVVKAFFMKDHPQEKEEKVLEFYQEGRKKMR